MNGRLFVRDYATGPAVMLLGGSPCPADHLSPLASALSKSHRVLLPDMPGYGRSSPLTGRYTFEGAQRMLEDELLAREIRELDVVGFSLGGYRALSLALSHRIRVRKVVSLGGFAHQPQESRGGFVQFASVIRSAGIDPAMIPPLMLTPGYLQGHPEVAADLRLWALAAHAEVLASEQEAISECEDLRPLLRGLPAPVLARVGELDVAVPAALSAATVAAVPSGTLQIVAGVGHGLLWEDLEATVAEVVRFLH